MEVGRAADPDADEPPISEEAQKTIEKLKDKRSGGGATERDGAETEISLANQQRPSSMGISFLAELSPDSKLVVTLKAGRYRPFDAFLTKEDGNEVKSRWWFRSRVRGKAVFAGSGLLSKSGKIQPSDVNLKNAQGLNIDIAVLSRPLPDSGTAAGTARLLTVYVVNRSAICAAGDDENADGSSLDAQCLFQVGFAARVRGADEYGAILPYPEPHSRGSRRGGTVSCSSLSANADLRNRPWLRRRLAREAWNHRKNGERSRGPPTGCRASQHHSRHFQRQSAPGPAQGADGAASGPGGGTMTGSKAAAEIVERYRAWIDEREAEIPGLAPVLRPAAERHIALCRECRRRMTEGLDLIASDSTVREAFELANYAILLQQLRSSSRAVREMQFNEDEGRMFFAAADTPDPLDPPKGRGKWRPFQLAFILMCLRSVADGKAPERETVELIWFPTGGGKTEAYLGLTAFALFHRRLSDPEDTGTHVLMRYTLRLLTAQQFQRAAGLLCAMEHIRKTCGAEDLGRTPFSVGIWLGGETTPDKRTDARSSLRALQNNSWDAEYNFVLLRCPWCGAQMGPSESPGHGGGRRRGRGRGRRQAATQRPNLVGLRQQGSTVVLHCPRLGLRIPRSPPSLRYR